MYFKNVMYVWKWSCVVFVMHACTFYSLSHALAVMTMSMFRAWSSSTHVARYFTHLLHIGLLGLFPSNASLYAVCLVFDVLAAPLPCRSQCCMSSRSKANATNSCQSKGFSLLGFSWLPTSRQISTNSAFEYIAICRIWFTFRRHEMIWLRRQETSSLHQVRDIASKTCTHAFQKQQKLNFIRKLPFKVQQPIRRELVDRRKCVK